MSSLAGAIAAGVVLLLAACGGGALEPGTTAAAPRDARAFPAAPVTFAGPVAPAVEEALGRLLPEAAVGIVDPELLDVVAGSHDPRLAWLLSDLLRFYQGGADEKRLVAAFRELTGVDVRRDPFYSEGAWRVVTDDLITWNLPAPPRYRQLKGRLYLALEPRWRTFFADAKAEIDWRFVAWGGVLIDDRSPGDPRPCPRGCIPALDDPALVPAKAGGWYPDDHTIFGIVVGSEAVAFPKNVMEVHELVNVTIGGRRLGIPYCTLCRSAQAYFADSVPGGLEPPVLRTSGLLSRSNKVMYDLLSGSVFDTFTGRALSGPLHAAGVELEQATVVTGTWGAWKRAHPATKIVARDGGIGRAYPDDPLHGRDDAGPIFPIGAADLRLPVQEQVLGVIAPDGRPVAFHAAHARSALAAGDRVALGGVELHPDGGGLLARSAAGAELPAHQAFWFAWSQFHPGTLLWGGAP